MRLINKGNEPEELAIFNRNNAKRIVKWDDECVPANLKPAIRKSLVIEQQGLCSYCMREIGEDCQIEHFIARSKNQSHCWDYNNMLGVDNSRTLPLKYKNLCENGRGDKAISINPLNPLHMQGIYYLKDGTIKHDVYQNDLNDVLKLNEPVFKAARKAKIDGIDRAIAGLRTAGVPNIYVHLKQSYDPQSAFAGVESWYISELNKNGQI